MNLGFDALMRKLQPLLQLNLKYQFKFDSFYGLTKYKKMADELPSYQPFGHPRRITKLRYFLKKRSTIIMVEKKAYV